jgi:hypothetical protein
MLGASAVMVLARFAVCVSASTSKAESLLSSPAMQLQDVSQFEGCA